MKTTPFCDESHKETPKCQVEGQVTSNGYVEYSVCVDCGEYRRRAAFGKCFVCYRKFRETRNPQLVARRHANNASSGRRTRYAQKLVRELSRFEPIEARVVDALMRDVSPVHLARIRQILRAELTRITEEQMQSHERRLELVVRIDEIEREGKQPVIVAAEDYVRKDRLPVGILASIDSSVSFDDDPDAELSNEPRENGK